MKRRHWLLLAVALVLPALQGCSNMAYYSQSLAGHFDLVSGGQRVEKLVDDRSRTPEFRQQMAQAIEIRRFATETLGLPDNDSYRSYVDTGREFVTWAVFAAPELSLDFRSWCFPVLGCVPYRGYFSQAAAEKYAGKIGADGFDTYVGGITAYSTLGWFDDPLLNTMFMRGDTYLAGLIFHELSHQRVYIQGDAAFNEAFAVAVETTGVKRWLKRNGDTAALRRYELAQQRKKDFLDLVAAARKDLQEVYAGPASDVRKRAAKAAVMAGLHARYIRLRDGRWGGYRGYDPWFDEPVNNAKLAATAVYSDLVPAFVKLLETCSGDYDRFYKVVKRIGNLAKGMREQALKSAGDCR